MPTPAPATTPAATPDPKTVAGEKIAALLSADGIRNVIGTETPVLKRGVEKFQKAIDPTPRWYKKPWVKTTGLIATGALAAIFGDRVFDRDADRIARLESALVQRNAETAPEKEAEKTTDAKSGFNAFSSVYLERSPDSGKDFLRMPVTYIDNVTETGLKTFGVAGLLNTPGPYTIFKFDVPESNRTVTMPEGLIQSPEGNQAARDALALITKDLGDAAVKGNTNAIAYYVTFNAAGDAVDVSRDPGADRKDMTNIGSASIKKAEEKKAEEKKPEAPEPK